MGLLTHSLGRGAVNYYGAVGRDSHGVALDHDRSLLAEYGLSVWRDQLAIRIEREVSGPRVALARGRTHDKKTGTVYGDIERISGVHDGPR